MKRSGGRHVTISDKRRDDDEQLRESLRNADLKKFDKLLSKAIVPPKPS